MGDFIYTFYRPIKGDGIAHTVAHLTGWSDDRKTARGAVASCGAGHNGPVEVLTIRPAKHCRECKEYEV